MIDKSMPSYGKFLKKQEQERKFFKLIKDKSKEPRKSHIFNVEDWTHSSKKSGTRKGCLL